MKKLDTKGFTLIELMIVIAIIGILAAIAIPNFITYRNKAYCTAAESDAGTITAEIANYFSIPANRTVKTDTLKAFSDSLGDKLSNNNGWTVETSGAKDTERIQIVVTDATERCPVKYQKAKSKDVDPKSYWDGAGKFIKIANTKS